MNKNAFWRVAAASVVGTDHARWNVSCQDAFVVQQRGATLVIAVADGGSRARLASVGATAACEVAAACAWDTLAHVDPTDLAGTTAGRRWIDLLRQVMATVVHRFGQLASGVSRLIALANPADLGCTVTILVIRAPWVAAAIVGDGFVVTRSGRDHLDLFAPPDYSEAVIPITRRVSDRTTFLTSSHAVRRARVFAAALTDLSGVAVSTDGLRGLALVHERSVAQHPYDPFFAPIFEQMASVASDDCSLVRLLASPKVTTLTGDDKTLVIAVPA